MSLRHSRLTGPDGTGGARPGVLVRDAGVLARCPRWAAAALGGRRRYAIDSMLDDIRLAASSLRDGLMRPVSVKMDLHLVPLASRLSLTSLEISRKDTLLCRDLGTAPRIIIQGRSRDGLRVPRRWHRPRASRDQDLQPTISVYHYRERSSLE